MICIRLLQLNLTLDQQSRVAICHPNAMMSSDPEAITISTLLDYDDDWTMDQSNLFRTLMSSSTSLHYHVMPCIIQYAA